MKHETDMEYQGRTVEVIYTITGKYWCGTYWQPPEYPEMEIQKVKYEGRDITGLINLTEIWEIVNEKRTGTEPVQTCFIPY